MVSKKSALRIMLLASAFLAVFGGLPGFAQTQSALVSTATANASSPIEIWGHERLAWDQPARESGGLGDLTFTAYVDGLVDQLEDVRCSAIQNQFGFECSSRLPRMTPGLHTIEITATRATDVSARSAALTVVLRARLETSSVARRVRVGNELDPEQVLGALVDVAAIAPIPNGSVLVGETRGRILTTRVGEPPSLAMDLRTVERSLGEVRLLALATGPDFSESRAVFAVYATPRGSRLARFTESSGVLLNHAVLRDNLPIGSPPRAALAIGPDQKIYLAVAGRVLRINLDGSTPREEPASGVFAAGVQQPVSLTWSVEQRVMWLLGSNSQGGSELKVIALGDRGDGTVVRSFELSQMDAAAVALDLRPNRDADHLILATRTTSDLLQWRIQFPETLLDQATWLPRGTFGEIASIASTTDGSIWIASRTAVFRVDLPR